MNRASNSQPGFTGKVTSFFNKIARVFSSSKSKYFRNLVLFILLYKIGEYVFNYLEQHELFSQFFTTMYYALSSLITVISVKIYSIFYSDISSDPAFLISINHVKTIQMMKGCTGLMQLFQIFFIMVFFPLNLKKKLRWLPVSFIIILLASVIHYLILIPAAHAIPDRFDFYHNVVSRIIFYLIFFLNFVGWNRSAEQAN